MTRKRTDFRRPESVLVVVYTRDGDFLVLERVSPAEFWQSVTGTLRWGESTAAAATREVCEETGIDSAAIRDAGRSHSFPILPAWRDRYAPGVDENLEHLCYLELQVRPEIRLNPAEHVAFRWLTLEDAISQLSSWTNRDALRRLSG